MQSQKFQIYIKNWQLNAHEQLLNENSFKSVIDYHFKTMNASVSIDENRRDKKMVYAYKSVNDLFSALRRNRPISCIKCENG